MKKKKKLYPNRKRRRRTPDAIDLREALAFGVSSFLQSIVRQALEPDRELAEPAAPKRAKMRYAGRGSTVAKRLPPGDPEGA